MNEEGPHPGVIIEEMMESASINGDEQNQNKAHEEEVNYHKIIYLLFFALL